jgi:transposase
MELSRELTQMDADQLRNLTSTLLAELAERDVQISKQHAELSAQTAVIASRDQAIANRDQELKHKQLKIDQLTHEMATLRRYRFGRHSEQLDVVQRSLLDESIDADIEAIALEIEALKLPSVPTLKDKPRRVALPASFPRREIAHEPENTHCSCGCSLERIGEDVSEKLDYTPGVFTVEKHIRGKWVCRRCERLVQKPVPPHVIDKGIPTAGLLAQVLVAKYLDHAPLYRQESIFERAGLALSRSTLAEWVGACGVRLQPLVEAMKEHLLKCSVLHADETPVPMLKPGLGRTHRAYLWSYSSSEYDDLQAVIYDFADGRGGAHAQAFLGDWTGKLVCDDYAGYKALFNRGIIEVGCMAHCPESGFIRRDRYITAEILGQRRSMTPDNNSCPIRWRQGRPADPAWVSRHACGSAKGRSGPRNAQGHRASFASWCSRSGWWSRCSHGRGNHGSPLYRLLLAARRPRNCVVACAA